MGEWGREGGGEGVLVHDFMVMSDDTVSKIVVMRVVDHAVMSVSSMEN